MSASVAAASPVYVSINAGGNLLRVRPSSIHLLSNENLGGLQWTSWGHQHATASGTHYGNSPSPGHMMQNPVEVTLTKRKRCGHRRVYTVVRVHFTAGVPYEGQSKTESFPFGCPS